METPRRRRSYNVGFICIDTKPPSTVTGRPACFSADAVAMSYKANRAHVLAIVQTPAGTKVWCWLCCCWTIFTDRRRCGRDCHVDSDALRHRALLCNGCEEAPLVALVLRREGVALQRMRAYNPSSAVSTQRGYGLKFTSGKTYSNPR